MGLQLLDDRFHTLLELSAVGCTCHHGSDIECDNTFLFEGLHFVVHDAQRESFDDGGLTDTGFSDKNRVVLFAARKDLYDAFYLHFAAYDRI